jgi:hypothetical protein
MRVNVNLFNYKSTNIWYLVSFDRLQVQSVDQLIVDRRCQQQQEPNETENRYEFPCFCNQPHLQTGSGG